MLTNRYGLSRDIPDHIKRIIRSKCGFGCVVCGSAIFQYEHLDPPFAEALEHDPGRIVLLCASCHDKVTRGIWSKDKVSEAMKMPRAKQDGHAAFSLDIDSKSDLNLRVGQTRFVGIKDIILIDGARILGVDPPEKSGTPPKISAMFYDRTNTLIARIVDNEWLGSTEAFDIEFSGKRVTIRNSLRYIDLILELNPPNGVSVEKLNLSFNGKTIIGNAQQGFQVLTPEAAVIIPELPNIIERAPHWLSISKTSISIGSDKVLNMVHNGKAVPLPGSMEITGVKVEHVLPVKEGIPMPPGHRPGDRVMKITKLTEAGKPGQVFFKIPLTQRSNIQPQLINRSIDACHVNKKVGRNDPCPCGSGKKYRNVTEQPDILLKLMS